MLEHCGMPLPGQPIATQHNKPSTCDPQLCYYSWHAPENMQCEPPLLLVAQQYRWHYHGRDIP